MSGFPQVPNLINTGQIDGDIIGNTNDTPQAGDVENVDWYLILSGTSTVARVSWISSDKTGEWCWGGWRRANHKDSLFIGYFPGDELMFAKANVFADATGPTNQTNPGQGLDPTQLTWSQTEV